MRKVLLFIIASFISSFAFAQHVEYYTSSQRYYVEPYIKADLRHNNHLITIRLPLIKSFQCYPPHNNQELNYTNYCRLVNKCNVEDMNGRAVYGIAVPYCISLHEGNQGRDQGVFMSLLAGLSFFDSVPIGEIERAWNNAIDTLQHRSELDRFKMWFLRHNDSDNNHPWLIDSVSVIPEWNTITDSRFLFPNMWIGDSINPFIGNQPYFSFPTLEVYFDQPFIVNDSFYVGSDFFPANALYPFDRSIFDDLFPDDTILDYVDSFFTLPQILNFLEHPASGDMHTVRCMSDGNLISIEQYQADGLWNGIFPILVPPSGCYKPGVLRASVIGYDSAVVEWMSRFWLPESRVEYGPAGFAPDSGTVIDGVTGNRITLHGLSEGTDYEVRVSNWCDSAYSDETVCLFRTALRCEPAGDVSLFVATDTTIQLAWEMPDSASWCEVEWGPEGFVEGEGTLLPHVTRGYLGGYVFMQHLAPATRYDVRVRCWCQHSQAFSPWREYNVATRGRYTISVASNNDDWGHVTGAGVYMEGERAMLNAVPASGVCHFRRWHDGDISNPRFVEVSGDSLFTAVFINDTVPVSVAVTDAPSCLTLRPNPASDRVEVVSCEAMAAIDLYDVTGRAAAHIEPRSETATLDVSALASGVYTVRATTQSGTVYTEKLLVKRQ